MLRVVLGIAIAIGSVVPAWAAETCEEEASTLHAHLDKESSRASKWNTIWAILFGAAVVGQASLAIAEIDPLGGEYDQDTKESLIVGASKATLAVGSKVILPLRIPVPSRTGDACADVKTLRKALRTAGEKERRSFWLTHIGGTTINIIGASILTYRRSFKVGAISFAISYPIGPASAYTQPRKSWKLWREQRDSWVDTAVETAVIGASSTEDGGAQLWIGGQW